MANAGEVAGEAGGGARLRSAALLARFIRLVAATSTKQCEPADYEARLNSLNPCIIALWHGQFMMIPALCPSSLPVRIMVARHGDAELLAQALEHFGMDLIRGAGAGSRGRDRGGAQALRAALAALEEGFSVPMTADVPPGPARVAGQGIVTLARLSGRPIVPVAVASSRYRALDTWSRMTINLPWSRLGVVVGEPIRVPRTLGDGGAERWRLAVEQAMNAATLRAYALAGADPARATPPGRAPANAAQPARPGLALGGYRVATRALLPLAPLILASRARRGKEVAERRGERLGQASLARPAGPLVWIHAASVGETNAVLPLLERLQESGGGRRTLLLTTGTVTSATLAAQRLPRGAIHQFVPLDAPQFVRRFLEHWQPSLAIFTESEIWPNLVLETATRRVPLVLVNGRLSKQSYRTWRKRPSIARPLFGAFDLVLAQNERLAERFAELGARRTRGVGNLKLDAPPPPVDREALARLRASAGNRPLLLAASTHEGEDDLIAAAHRAIIASHPDLLTIIAPRHPERGERIAACLAGHGLASTRRSTGGMPEPGRDVYIADTIGELGTLYSLAPVAFIGGSFTPRGGQNPIEAVKLGSAVLTGPHWHNFKDTYAELIRRQGVREVHSAEELAGAVAELLGDGRRLAEMVGRARTTLDNMTGALERTLAALDPFLPEATRAVHVS